MFYWFGAIVGGLMRGTAESPLFNPSAAEITCVQCTKKKKKKKSTQPCHVGIHWKALTEYVQMSTHLSWFRSFFRFLHHFLLAKLATTSIRVKSVCPGPPSSERRVVIKCLLNSIQLSQLLRAGK